MSKVSISVDLDVRAYDEDTIGEALDKIAGVLGVEVAEGNGPDLVGEAISADLYHRFDLGYDLTSSHRFGWHRNDPASGICWLTMRGSAAEPDVQTRKVFERLSDLGVEGEVVFGQFTPHGPEITRWRLDSSVLTVQTGDLVFRDAA